MKHVIRLLVLTTLVVTQFQCLAAPSRPACGMIVGFKVELITGIREQEIGTQGVPFSLKREELTLLMKHASHAEARDYAADDIRVRFSFPGEPSYFISYDGILRQGNTYQRIDVAEFERTIKATPGAHCDWAEAAPELLPAEIATPRQPH